MSDATEQTAPPAADHEAAASAVVIPTRYIPYTLEFDEAKSTLWGVVPTRPTAQDCAKHDSPYRLSEVEREVTRVTLPKMQMDLKKLGYDEFFYPRNSLEAFIRNIKRNFPGRYQLAERRDATIKVTVSRDRLNARAQTSQPWGGAPINVEMVTDAIAKAKLDERCIIYSAVDKLAESRKALDLLIAEAHPAENGKDGELHLLVKSKKDVERNVESMDAIDLHEVYDYTVVDEGDELARRIPPTEGKPGLNVLGKVIKPKKGKTVKLPKKASGVDYHPENKDVLIAAIKGHPVASAGQVKVDPVFTVRDVDFKTGNIDYDGTVIITGNVRVGFEVKATGDIFVKGFVNKCKLISGGSIFLSGGVQGDSSNEEHTALIKANNNIEAKFINESKVNCLGELIVREYVLNCETTALKGVSLGEKAGKGALIGGVTRTNGAISLNTLGSEAYVTTEVELGTNSTAQVELEKLKLKKTRREKETEQLEGILEKLNQSEKPTEVGQVTLDKARKVEDTIISLKKIIEDYEAHINELQQLVPDADSLCISVKKSAFPNVQVCINDVGYELNREYKKVKIEKSGSDILFNALN